MELLISATAFVSNAVYNNLNSNMELLILQKI